MPVPLQDACRAEMWKIIASTHDSVKRRRCLMIVMQRTQIQLAKLYRTYHCELMFTNLAFHRTGA